MFALSIQEPQRRTCQSVNLAVHKKPKVAPHIRNYTLAFRTAN
jgi:hypothetical protein